MHKQTFHARPSDVRLTLQLLTSHLRPDADRLNRCPFSDRLQAVNGEPKELQGCMCTPHTHSLPIQTLTLETLKLVGQHAAARGGKQATYVAAATQRWAALCRRRWGAASHTMWARACSAPKRRHGDEQRRELASSCRRAKSKSRRLEVDGTEGCEAAGNG